MVEYIKKLKIKWLLIIVVLVIMSIGFQFRDKIPPQYKNLLLINEKTGILDDA